MRRAVKQLGGSGVRVSYDSGITRGLDSVVRQSVLWGAKQSSIRYNEMIGEELGCDGYEIDAHSSPRPSHMFMQGQQYAIGGARTVNGVRYEGFAESGAESALQDYGCLHFKTPIILGISEPTYSKEQLAQIEADNKKIYTIDGIEGNNYDWSQRMRNLESAVRREKRELEIFNASGDYAGASQCRERIKAYQSKYKQISEVTGIAEDRKRMAFLKSKNVLTDNNDRAIIINENMSRNMANGNRQPAAKSLNDDEIKEIKKDIRAIRADENVFQFNVGKYTAYNDMTDKIKIRGDVFPDETSLHPRDLMSSRAVLAHEYYGHRASRGTKLPKGAWNDEFRASYMAAKNAPNLTSEDRRYLVLDALERAKEAGVTIKNNKFIRGLLYGY